MSFIPILLAAIRLLCLIGPPAAAFTHAELEARLNDHPALASLGYRAAAHRDSALAALALPDPVISFGINNFPVADPAFDRFLPTNKSLGVRQALPNADGLLARAGEAQRTAARLDAMRGQTLAALRADLAAVLAALEAARERDALLQEHELQLEELAASVAAELEAGRPIAFQLADVEARRAGIERRRVALRGETARLRARVVELTGVDAAPPPPAAALAVWNGDTGAFWAVRVAAGEVWAADAGVDAAEAAFLPDWAVSLTWQQREDGRGGVGSSFEGNDWVSANVSVSVPLWTARRQEPGLRAAHARRAAAHSGRLAAARAALKEWDALNAEILAVKASLIVLEGMIASLAGKAAAVATNYEAGIVELASLVEAEIAILSVRAEQASERARRTELIARANALLVTP